MSLVLINTGHEAIRVHLTRGHQSEKEIVLALRLLRHHSKEGALRQQTVSAREDDGWENSATTNDQGLCSLSVFPYTPSLSLSNFILMSFITEPWWRGRNKTYFVPRPWEILLMTKSDMTGCSSLSVIIRQDFRQQIGPIFTKRNFDRPQHIKGLMDLGIVAPPPHLNQIAHMQVVGERVIDVLKHAKQMYTYVK